MNKLSANEIDLMLTKLPKWSLIENRIERNFVFANFMEGIEFINKVAELAEEKDHHPDILLFSYRNVRISLATHSVGGLTQNDFGFAEELNKRF